MTIEVKCKYSGAYPANIPVALTAEHAASLFRDGAPGLLVMCGDLVSGRQKLCYFAHEAAEFFAASG